jgi:hypothetical protein
MAAAYMISRAVSVLMRTRLFGLLDRICDKQGETDCELQTVPSPYVAETKPQTAGHIKPAEVPAAVAAEPPLRDGSKIYGSLFLHKRTSEQKRQTYINSNLFAKISDFLAVAATGVSVPTFLDNLIEHHLERYRDEINALYSDKFKKPL